MQIFLREKGIKGKKSQTIDNPSSLYTRSIWFWAGAGAAGVVAASGAEVGVVAVGTPLVAAGTEEVGGTEDDVSP